MGHDIDMEYVERMRRVLGKSNVRVYRVRPPSGPEVVDMEGYLVETDQGDPGAVLDVRWGWD